MPRWMSWEEAFARARAEAKPLLLVLTAPWCHWCRVLEAEGLADPGIAALVERAFVPVEVNADLRPDIHDRYNLGGLPTVAVLAPDGALLAGSTFLPAADLRRLLEEAERRWRSEPGAIAEETARQARLRARWAGTPPRPGLEPAVVDRTLAFLRASFDPEEGGFGLSPKFPHPDALRFLLAIHSFTGDDALARIARRSLDALATGGLWDAAEGGFFRYSPARDWSRPHTEKLAAENARLAVTFLEAGQALGEPRYREHGRATLRFLLERLSLDEAAFAASVAADEAYYRLPLDARREEEPPAVDPTVYADANARVAAALLLGAAVLGEPAWEDRAVRVLGCLERLAPPAGAPLAHALLDGRPALPGLLRDQVAALAALVEAYQATGEEAWLDWGRHLADWLGETLRDPEAGGFLDRPPEAAPGYLGDRLTPLGANAEAALALRDLAWLTGEERYREWGEAALRALAPRAETARLWGASYALAVALWDREPVEITVFGPPTAAETRALRRAADALYLPGKLVRPVGEGAPALVLCAGGVCFPPLEDPRALAEVVAQLPR